MTCAPDAAAANFVVDSDVVVDDALVKFMFGDQLDPEAFKRARRRLYHLASEVAPEHRPPIFRLGPRRLAGRKSSLRRWFAEREAAALAPQKLYKRRGSAGHARELPTPNPSDPVTDPISEITRETIRPVA
jgi:hypothetical protein